MLKLTEDEVECIYHEDISQCERYELHELLEEGSDHKYIHYNMIVKDVINSKFYTFHISKTGSPYTDWYYEWPTKGFEVKKIEVKTFIWRQVE